jgi:3-dehydroquinate synthase
MPSTLMNVVARCCTLKAEVVAADETESGERAILNFGHTIGHGLEADGRLRRIPPRRGHQHRPGRGGAAVRAGCPRLSEKDAERIRELFMPRRAADHAEARRRRSATALFDAMRIDKKVSGGELKFVLAKSIGEVRLGPARVRTADINAVLNTVVV